MNQSDSINSLVKAILFGSDPTVPVCPALVEKDVKHVGTPGWTSLEAACPFKHKLKTKAEKIICS